ncbi:MAG: hypothetical protein HZR80_07725 [Candidatus Heimdallarchaeota archaeon]
MASIYSKIKCPNCELGSLSKIDRMVRCTCGWWTQVEEEEISVSITYATPVAS